MKKFLTLFAMTLMAFMSSIALVKAQSADDSQPPCSVGDDETTRINVAKAYCAPLIKPAQDDLEASMKVDKLHAFDPSYSSQITPYLTNLLQAQLAISNYKFTLEIQAAVILSQLDTEIEKEMPDEQLKNPTFNNNFRLVAIYKPVTESVQSISGKIERDRLLQATDNKLSVNDDVFLEFLLIWKLTYEQRTWDSHFISKEEDGLLTDIYSDPRVSECLGSPSTYDENKRIRVDESKRIRVDESKNLEDYENSISNMNTFQLDQSLAGSHFTVDESTSFNQFNKKLLDAYNVAYFNYKRNEIPFYVEDNKKVAPFQIEEQYSPEQAQKIKATFATLVTFSLLKQAVAYEYLHVSLTRRNYSRNPNEAAAFRALQQKLEQLLANIDVCNPVALLQAQLDMIAYENVAREDPTKWFVL